MNQIKKILIEQKTGKKYLVKELNDDFHTSEGFGNDWRNCINCGDIDIYGNDCLYGCSDCAASNLDSSVD